VEGLHFEASWLHTRALKVWAEEEEEGQAAWMKARERKGAGVGPSYMRRMLQKHNGGTQAGCYKNTAGEGWRAHLFSEAQAGHCSRVTSSKSSPPLFTVVVEPSIMAVATYPCQSALQNPWPQGASSSSSSSMHMLQNPTLVSIETGAAASTGEAPPTILNMARANEPSSEDTVAESGSHATLHAATASESCV